MALLTDRKSLRDYDVIIVGSGAGGGMAATSSPCAASRC